MGPIPLEIMATVLFGIAIAHTFSVKRLEHLAHRYPNGSVGENLFHLLGEVEVVFGLWASIFLIGMALMMGSHEVTHYLESTFTLPGTDAPVQVNFTEPFFVVVIMAISATRPVLQFTERIINAVARVLPLPKGLRFYVSCLIVGPLLGSLITEPAAMTVTALLLKRRFYDLGISDKLMYTTIGVLFVNISIGGTLTNFAAPPVLMVASPDKFDLTMATMITQFGWKAALAVIANTMLAAYVSRRELNSLADRATDIVATPSGAQRRAAPLWLVVVHLMLMALVVFFSHHITVFMIVFLFFLGVAEVTAEHQDELKLRESLLVGYFLLGLVILGGLQRWWLEPVLSGLSDGPLFLGATGLTAITDNAALTYLGSLVPNLPEASQYALVAGAVTGGGLTVIANAPNPAGFGILKSSFGEDGISPLRLLVSALPPTIIAGLAMWFLPHLG